MDRNVGREGFVDGVDLFEVVDAVGRGFDVDDGVLEGDGLGETGWMDKGVRHGSTTG